MPLPAHLTAYWADVCRATSRPAGTPCYEAFAFGDSEAMAEALGALVLQGVKRATAACLWAYEAEGQPLPQPGHLSIVTRWSGEPLCVIETRSVEVMPFSQVDADFAATEGEGDGSLAFWRQAHRAFFTRDCERLDRSFTEDMPVVCERFERVYPLPLLD